jgi:hypothetical protein
MRTTTNLSSVAVWGTAQSMIDARIPYVHGVIYEYDQDPGATHCTPVRTFNGRACDCYLLIEKEGGFTAAPGFEHPIPVLHSNLGKPVAAIR